MTFKTVSKDEFEKFARDYTDRTGRRLVKDVCAAGEPPIGTLNDFERGDWPDSVVARVILHAESYPNRDGTKRPNEYQVTDNEP